MSERKLGQANFMVKALFIVIASIIFIFIINYFASFRYETIQQKGESNFKISVLNVLQKIVSDENCLAYKNGNVQKPVLSMGKIESFASVYKSTEPECAKAADFDYAIRIVQLPYNFTLDPGQKKVRGELKLSDEFSSHPPYYQPSSTSTVFFDCNFVPEEHPELCKNTELDMMTCGGCREDPKKNCPFPQPGGHLGGICCIYYLCPLDACACTEMKPGLGDCGSGCIVTSGCDLSKCQWYPWHGACGMTFEYTLVPSGEIIDVKIEKNVWEFGLSFGQTSFSPPKARTGEVQLSLPITLKYSETFSTEGIIYIYAVRGELEDLHGLLADICEKATAGEKEIKFTKQFHFSYPVIYDSSSKQLCMGSSCKFFDCNYQLEFKNIEREGDYILEFSFDLVAEKIVVS